MPSHLHESIVHLLRKQPAFAEQLLRTVLGLELPGTPKLRASPQNLSEIKPPEFRVDAVYELRGVDDKVKHVTIFEIQLDWKRRKLFTWPAYMGILRAEFECPVLLVVITTDPKVARDYAAPIDLDGRGSMVVPQVIGPSAVPEVVDPAQAEAMPELAVLSVMVHPDAEAIANAALAAAAKLDDERAKLYADLIHAYVSSGVRKVLEASMGLGNYEYQSDFAKRFIAEGRAEGGRAVLLVLLDARGLRLTEEDRARIEACDDLEALEQWTRAAATAASTDAIFGDDA